MFDLRHPLVILVSSMFAFSIAARIGAFFHARTRRRGENAFDDLKFILGATLTLLGLIIGFTFSMAVSRYDQRKNLEEEEANAIGTEYTRADLLAPNDAIRVRTLLKDYLNQRMLYYTVSDAHQLRQISAETATLQSEMWSTVAVHSFGQPTAVMALVLAGMNTVLNSQGYSQAAWRNRIPVAAWLLLVTIGLFCIVLLGYVVEDGGAFILLILPIALSICLFLIAEIDSPRRGVIRVHPENLQNLVTSLPSP